MRKWFFVLLIVFLAVASFACNQNDDDDQAADDDDDDNDDNDNDDNDSAPFNPFLDPSEPGPFPAGNTTRYFTDAARDLSCGDGPRILMTEIWYPAAENAAEYPENYIEDFFLGREEEAREAVGEDMDSIPSLPTGSYRDAPLTDALSTFPVLFFSHGFSSNRFQNYTMAAYLATHGYVVIAPDHICNAMVTLTPDAVVVGTMLSLFTTLPERKGDLLFLIDEMADNPPEFLQGRLDLTRIGLFGHSFGGLTVTEVLKETTAAKAMLQMASFGFPPVPESVTATTMFWAGKQDKIMWPYRELHHTVIDQMPRPNIEMVFYETGHFAFSDLCLFSPDLAAHGNGCGTESRMGGTGDFTNPDHDELHQVLNSYATAFFGAVLFEFPTLIDYIAENHFPEMMEHAVNQ
ncbi:MAG: hypothetical protein P9L99_07285 [Candidatus Lernaella stagnicola]|nr:hypothetical protein [Candidatus Lernaella stagnicola]